MLIGVVHPSFTTIGGAELLMARYASWLHGAGHAVRVVTSELDATRWPQLAALDVVVSGKRWWDGLGVPGSYPKLGRRTGRMAQGLRGVDVVLAGNYPGTVVAGAVDPVGRSVWVCMEPNRRLHPRETFRTLAARVAMTAPASDTPLLSAARALFSGHDAAVRRGGEIVTQQSADIAAVQRLTRVVAISDFSADSVRAVYRRDASTVVYPTIDAVSAPRRSAGLRTDGLRVLVHGRLELLKNIDVVLAGFAAFAARHAGAHEMHVVGTGPDAARLNGVSRALGVESAVHFHGFLGAAALEAVYDRCEVMALLPPDEPFGMVFPEAAMRGLLLVGPDHGGPFEILDGGRHGWAVDVFSPAPLADALAEIWRLPAAEVDRRRDAAAAACASRYGPEATLPGLMTQLSG